MTAKTTTIEPLGTESATVEPVVASDAAIVETAAQGERLLNMMKKQEELAQIRRQEKALAAEVKAARDSGEGKLEGIIARQLATLPIWDRRSCSSRVYRRVEAGQRIEVAIADVLAQLGAAAKEDVENKQAGKPSLGLDAPAKATTPAPAE